MTTRRCPTVRRPRRSALLALLLPALVLLGACAGPPLSAARWQLLETGSDASLRGVSAPGDGVVWASGSGGTVLLSTDGGASWQARPVPPAPGADPDDLRDIEALDARRAWVLAITDPARILATDDGGLTWRELYRAEAPVFLDALALLDTPAGEPQRLLAFGDPVDGAFVVLTGDDQAGLTRVPAESLPAPLPGEAAFAASGTCLVTHGAHHAWIATGGAAARVLRSTDGGQTWQASEVPVRQGGPTEGLYSVAFRDELHGVAVGGAYDDPGRGGDNAAFSTDGGVTWQAAEVAPEGYRSAVAWLPGEGQRLLAVGREGASVSEDGGRTWVTQEDVAGYYAVDVTPEGTMVGVGAEGRAGDLAKPGR